MKNSAMRLAACGLMAALCLAPAAAQTAATSSAKPASATGSKVPMHPSTLTLHPHGGSERRRPSHRHVRHKFHQTTPVHRTMAGPRT